MPSRLCSSDHLVFGAAPAPRPNTNRPPLISCSEAAAVTVMPAVRLAALTTSVPIPMVEVTAASAPASEKHSSIRSLANTEPLRWS